MPMETAAEVQKQVGDSIDKLITIDATGRGVVGVLHEAARLAQGGQSTTMRVAQALVDRVRRKEVVVIATGMPTYPWFRPEQDGLVGAATLARAVILGIGAKPVIVTDPVNADACRAAIIGAGLQVGTPEESLSLPTTVPVISFPTDWDEAAEAVLPFFKQFNPRAFVTIERGGANEHNVFHSGRGKDLSAWCGKVDLLFAEAQRRGTLTVGIGDGGNELGCGLIKRQIIDNLPAAALCTCGCGGSIVPDLQVDMLVMSAISNWGAYGIEACLATILRRPEVLHTKLIDARVHELCAAAGANNGGHGLLDLGTDTVPLAVHGSFLDLMAQVVKGGLDPVRVVGDPKFLWLYPPD